MSEKEKDKVEEQKVARAERYSNRIARRDNTILLAINPTYNSTPSPINSEINVSVINSRASNKKEDDKPISSFSNEDANVNSSASWNLRLKKRVKPFHTLLKQESLKNPPELTDISTSPRAKEELLDKGFTPPFQGKFDTHFRAPFSKAFPNPFLPFDTPLSPLSVLFKQNNLPSPEAVTPFTTFEIGSSSSQAEFRTPFPRPFVQELDPKNEKESPNIPNFTAEEITASLEQFIEQVKVEANESPIPIQEKRNFRQNIAVIWTNS